MVNRSQAPIVGQPCAGSWDPEVNKKADSVFKVAVWRETGRQCRQVPGAQQRTG